MKATNRPRMYATHHLGACSRGLSNSLGNWALARTTFSKLDSWSEDPKTLPQKAKPAIPKATYRPVYRLSFIRCCASLANDGWFCLGAGCLWFTLVTGYMIAARASLKRLRGCTWYDNFGALPSRYIRPATRLRENQHSGILRTGSPGLWRLRQCPKRSFGGCGAFARHRRLWTHSCRVGCSFEGWCDIRSPCREYLRECHGRALCCLIRCHLCLGLRKHAEGSGRKTSMMPAMNSHSVGWQVEAGCQSIGALAQPRDAGESISSRGPGPKPEVGSMFMSAPAALSLFARSAMHQGFLYLAAATIATICNIYIYTHIHVLYMYICICSYLRAHIYVIFHVYMYIGMIQRYVSSYVYMHTHRRIHAAYCDPPRTQSLC